jgi:hypothetical protein
MVSAVGASTASSPACDAGCIEAPTTTDNLTPCPRTGGSGCTIFSEDATTASLPPAVASTSSLAAAWMASA